MPLPTLSGEAFCIAKDGIETAESKGGVTYARVPLAFSERYKDDDDEWQTRHELRIDTVAYGDLANFLADHVIEPGPLYVVLQPFQDNYENKDGDEVFKVGGRLLSATPIVREKKKSRGGGRSSGGSSRSKSSRRSEPVDDPWGSGSSSFSSDDEPPF